MKSLTLFTIVSWLCWNLAVLFGLATLVNFWNHDLNSTVCTLVGAMSFAYWGVKSFVASLPVRKEV